MRMSPFVPWAAAVVVAISSLLLVMASHDAASAGTFNPTLTLTVPDSTPEKPADINIKFDVPEGDVMFAGAVTYYPLDWGIVRGDKIPVGAPVGTVNANATLGLVNGACNQLLPVQFDMFNASLNKKDTVSFLDADNNNTADFAEDKDKNGLPDGVDKYPSFLDKVFNNATPIRRYAGVTIVASTPVLLQFLIFPPGTDVSPRVPIPHDANLGYPSVVQLQDIGDPDAVPQPGSITDFCSPLTSEVISLGQTTYQGKTYPLSVNPKNGKYTFNAVSAGQRDADLDGYENSLDTCPYVKNVGDPRIQYSGDADGDGLDAACDPMDNPDTGGTNSDQDGDGYLNRQDNCPLVANGEQETSNQTDTDLDQIGDACDKNKDVPDGELILQQPTSKITIGDGTGPGGVPSNCPQLGCYDLAAATQPPAGNDTSPTSDSGGGSSTIIIIIAIVAAVVILGGGGFFFMKGRGGGGG